MRTTQGPWFIHEGDDYLTVYSKSEGVAMDITVYTVKYPSNEDRANARAICHLYNPHVANLPRFSMNMGIPMKRRAAR